MLKRLSRKRAYIVGAAVLTVLIASAAGFLLARTGREQDRAWQRVTASGTLRIGLDPSYPPFEYVDEDTGQVQGYDVDLAREIGRRLGLEVEFVNIGFDSLHDAVQTGKVDAAISGIPYDPTRTEDISYGVWYFNAGQLIVVRADENNIATVNDFSRRRVGVELGSTADLEVRRLQKRIRDIDLASYPTTDDALIALANRQVDVVIADAVSTYLFMAEGGAVRVVGEPISDESYAVVTGRKSSQLRAAIDTAIEGMRADGFLDALRDKWLLRQRE